MDQGYSPDEIISKSRSLKGVMEPFSTQGNLDLLKTVGLRSKSRTILKNGKLDCRLVHYPMKEGKY